MGMAGSLRRMRRWRAVAWVPTGNTDDGGERTYQAPVEIKCRWEDYTGEDFDGAGRKFVAKGRVFVDRDLPLGTILRKPATGANQKAGVALALLTTATGDGPHAESTVFENDQTYKVRRKEDVPLLRPSADEHRTVVLSGRND